MLVTDCGIVKAVSAVQLRKALFPMLVILGPSVIFTSEGTLAKLVVGILPTKSKVTDRPVLFGNLLPISVATPFD